MSNAVAEAIAQAQANAAAIAPVTANTNTNVAPAVQGQAPSLTDFANATGADVWLKVKEGGLQIGDDPKFHEQLTFRIDFSDIDTFFSASGGNPPVYAKSRDRVLSETGKAWSVVLQELSQLAGRQVRDFLSATLPLEVVDDIQGKTSVTAAGTIVGYTLAYTGSQEFGRLQKRMIKEGLPLDGVYLLTVGAVGAKNANGNQYAKIQFLDIKPDDAE